MGFLRRWTAAVLLVFLMVVYWLADSDHSSCDCECPTPVTITCPASAELERPPDLPQTQTQTFHWHKTVQKGQGGSEVIPKGRHRAPRETRPEVKNPAWTLDCITWDNKWENTPLEAEPHDFYFDTHLYPQRKLEDRKNDVYETYQKPNKPRGGTSSGQLQMSGAGTSLDHAQGAIAALHVIIAKLKPHLGTSKLSLLDVGCGDLQWMSKFLLSRSDIQYTCIEIIDDIVKHHKQVFAKLPSAKFVHFDIVDIPFNHSYDLVLCRDIFQTMPHGDALQALEHISASKSKFMLATIFPDTTENPEVDTSKKTKQWYPYNLEIPPFSLEPPICTSYDWNLEHLALWPLPLRQKYEF